MEVEHVRWIDVEKHASVAKKNTGSPRVWLLGKAAISDRGHMVHVHCLTHLRHPRCWKSGGIAKSPKAAQLGIEAPVFDVFLGRDRGRPSFKTKKRCFVSRSISQCQRQNSALLPCRTQKLIETEAEAYCDEVVSPIHEVVL